MLQTEPASNVSSGIIAIDSSARNGDIVARRRFQKGSVFENPTHTLWLGTYSEYVLNSEGVETRKRKQIVLGPRSEMTKREAWRKLQPCLNRVNATIAAPARENKNISFAAFAARWENDNLSLSKPSTQSGMRTHLKQLKDYFGEKSMREIDASDLQSLIARCFKQGLKPKTIRNLWITVRLIWSAALTQQYVNQVLPKPKLPKANNTVPRYFTLDEVTKIISKSQGEMRVFYWLAAETGLRQGELMGLRLTDIKADRIMVNQSVWNGRIQTPKTENAIRTLAISPQLSALLHGQIKQQLSKGHHFLFTASTGSPWDANLIRKRKLRPLLRSLGIEQAGFHAFRHFNSSLLGHLRIPLKTIQERMGHARSSSLFGLVGIGGSLTLDVYTHSDWPDNVTAAVVAGQEIDGRVNGSPKHDPGYPADSGDLTAIGHWQPVPASAAVN